MDTSQIIFQVVVSGLIIGTIYVLIAMGMTLLYGIMHIVNFAHGEVYMLGAFTSYYLVDKLGVDYFLSFLILIPIFALIGIILQAGFLNHVRDSFFRCLVLTIGLSLLIQALGWMVFGIHDKSLPSAFPGIIRFWGIVISKERLVAALIALGLVGLLFILVDRTRIGRAMRAIEQDNEAASLFGIKSGYVALIACIISCILAGMAGALLAPVFVVNPSIGTAALLKAFVIIIIGGMGSIPGCLIAGLLLGVVESVSSVLIGAELAAAVYFLFMVGVLVVKPSGLMGHA